MFKKIRRRVCSRKVSSRLGVESGSGLQPAMHKLDETKHRKLEVIDWYL